MKFYCSLLLCMFAAALSAAPEIVEMPVAYRNVWASQGRGEVQARLTRAKLDGRENAVIVDYDFSRAPDRRNSFFRCNMDMLLTGMPQSFSVELYNGTGHPVPAALFLLDRTGEVFLLRTRTEKKGWNNVTIPMHRFAAWRSGDGNNKPDLPLTLAAVLVDMPGRENETGRFGFGKITVRTDMEPVEVTGYPALPKFVVETGPVEFRLNLNSRNQFPVEAYSYTLKAVDLYSKKTVLERNEPFSGDRFPEALSLALPNGQIQVEFAIRRGDMKILDFKGSVARLMPEALSVDPTVKHWEYEYSPLGGVHGFVSPEEMALYGGNWIRFEHPNWKNNEVSPGKFDFTAMKGKLKPFIDSNIRPVILQCLYHYPEFASIADPSNFSLGYGRHFREEAEALKDVTRYFELGNEDNGHTKFLYTEVGRHAAAGIRSAQPFAVLANSGTAHIDYSWLEFQRSRRLLEVLDALCVHPYTNNSTPSQGVSAEKGDVYKKLSQLHDIVDETGGMKQLWSTEYGWPNSPHPNGEHDRADLYVREMFIGDMANLEINGLYTWARDYGIIGRPAGVAIQAFARMRQGHRFAGFYREGDIYVAVYERNGEGTAAVWQAESGLLANPVKGEAYFDLFGNPLKAEEVKISQSPVYVRRVAPEVLKRARASRAAIAKERFEKNAKGFRFELGKRDSAALFRALERWSKGQGSIGVKEQAAVSRLLDYAVAAARFDGGLPAGKESSSRRKVLEDKVLSAHANLEDIPSVRYLLDYAAKLEAEAAVNQEKESLLYTVSEAVYGLAGRFARDGFRIQYGVFANLYMRQGESLKERLTFVPGRRTAVSVRVSSYAPGDEEALIRPVLPEGWKAIPETRKVKVSPGAPVFADFMIECPVKPAARNMLEISVELPGRVPRVTGFNDLAVVPALTVQCEAVPGALPETPLTLIIDNQESAPISGQGIVTTPDGNRELARISVESLAPYKQLKLPVALSAVTPEVEKEWMLAVRFKLEDGREFSVPFDVDFVHATAIPAPLKIDARLDEWKNALPLKLNKQEYTRGSYGDGWTPEDCSAVSMMMWDGNFLYFAAAVKDQTFNQQFVNDSTWQQDSIQIIFADAEERKHFQINLALTPAGPQAWGDRLLKEAKVAVEYRDGTIFYEAAVPWSAFPGKLKEIPQKREFLYGIAVNDDDAIVPRRFLERFEGSIVHGKRIDAFARVTLGGEAVQAEESAEVFYDDFAADAPDKAPLKWLYHRNLLPADSIRVVETPDAGSGKALRLDNRIGNKPNHFAICIAELQLEPGARYELSARMKNVPEKAGSVLGVCADKWGNKSQSYAKMAPSKDWQDVKLIFHAPVNGNINLIIRNVTAMDGMLIDTVRVKKLL